MKEPTQILHTGEEREACYGAVNPPVVHASLFTFESYRAFREAFGTLGKRDRRPVYVYSRHSNPTVHALEQKMAVLEQAEAVIAFSSGMGAITAALLALLGQGDHLLVVDCVYGPARQFCDQVLGRMGVETTYFAPAASADLSGYLKPNTRLIYLESPGSLTFDVQDLGAVAELARARGILTLADNSWATPLYQKPLTLGIDLVVHSGSKYIAGHSDLTLGLLACSEALFQRVKPVATMLGANLAPGDAYLALRGLRTLPVRMAQHQASALALARWLQERPEVQEVRYPGLPDFPGHELAARQQNGYSSLFSFRLQPAPEAARHAFVDALELFLIGVSWGGYESLMLPLAGVQQGDDAFADMFRTSIGLEDVEDLRADLARGLAAWRAAM
jgi:cystathionine beta-lyase